MKKKALGKGLNALIGDIEEDIVTEEDYKNVIEIPLSDIKPNPYQPRKKFDEEKLAELAQSIQENGIIQPIVVTKKENYYQIVVGERRYRASLLLEKETIPCIVKDFEEKQLLEIALIENLQREDLNPIEVAYSYQELLVKLDLTHEALAQKIGKSRVAITNTLRLLKLPEKIKQDVLEERLTEGHAKAILMAETVDKMLFLREKVLEKGLSVRETELLARKIARESQNSKPKNKLINPEIADLENYLTEIIGTKVIIKDKGNKGKIEIEYYSLEDFERIKKILTLLSQRNN